MTASGRCRPVRPRGPIPASVAIVLGWWVVAHSSGQGWVQVLGDVVAAGMLVGLVGPWFLLRRARVRAVAVPSDGAVGSPFEVAVESSRAVRMTPVDPPGPEAYGAAMVMIPVRRGVVRSVTAEVACAAPFGLQWWSRRIRLDLPAPVFVAPRRGPAAPLEPFVPAEGAEAGGGAPRPGQTGDLRAPRPYQPGDARRLVHWPASAHTGRLMVRDLERDRSRPAELVLDLPQDPDLAEDQAERALGTVLALLERGIPVLLTTDEEDGRRSGTVTTRTQAARRLAAAVARAPGG